MAEANVGDITARLRVDATEWQRGLQAAQAQLQQFAQQITRLTSQLNQFSTAFQQAFAQNQQGLTALPQRAQQASQSFQQFNTQVNQTNQAFTVVNQTVQQFNTQIANTATTVNQTRQAMQQAHGATSGLAQILQVAAGIGLATSIQGMIQAVVSFGREVVQTGARLEQLRTSLTAIAGSTTGGTQQFQFLFQTAQRLGVAFDPLAQGWRRLTAAATAANIPMADQQRLMTAVAVEARRVGTTTEELNRLLTGLAQVFSKGKLSAEEWRQQIGEALPTATAALTRGMGRTTEELDKLMTTGSIGIKTFAGAFTRGLEDVQQASGKMADGATQAFNRLKTAWQAFQDALANSGVNQYFAQVADNLREMVEFSTKLLRPSGQGPLQGPTPQGTTLSGGTASQQQEAVRLQSLIDRYTQQLGAGTPVMQTQRAEQVARAKEQLDQLREAMNLTETQATAQAKVTTEVNKTTTAQGIQTDYVKDLRKAVDDLRKAREDYNKEAALAPERMGRPGTAEFLEGQRKAVSTQLEALTTLAARSPQGAVLPGDLRQELAAEDIQYGRLGRQIDALKDKERERERLIRETAAQAKQAISQEITLTAQLAQAKTFLARPEERPAEQAASRVRQQGAEIQRTVDQALRQFQESAALRQRAPQLQQEFEALKAALPGQTEAAALQAFNKSIEQDALEPLRRMAETYGQVKAARDADKASTLEAAAANTVHAEEATKLANAIREVAQIEAQLPELRRQAAASAPAGAAAIKAVQDEAAALKTLEENLEQSRISRHEGGFPFGRTREELRLQQRTQEDIRTPEGQQQAQQIQQLRQEQEKLNFAVEVWYDLSQTIGQSWSQSLMSVIDGTISVSQAFEAMGKAILKTMADIAAQQATMALFKLGAGLLTAGLTGGLTGGATTSGPSGLGTSSSFIGQMIAPQAGFAFGAQHGAHITQPTNVLVGEGQGSHGSSEWIVNDRQMQSLMTSAVRSGSQGGQESQVSIHNYPDRKSAEAGAAQQRNQGHQAIVNAVLEELSVGESSRINRSLRALQR